MKLVPYAHLLSLRSADINELIRLSDGFAIVVNRKLKNKIVKFLENEKRFLGGKKNLVTRLAYIWGARGSFSIIPFVSIWNRAMIEGITIQSIDEVNSEYHLRFGRR